MNKALRGSISWFDAPLVDFGDYETAFSRFANPRDKIQFYYTARQPFNIRFYHGDDESLDQLYEQVDLIEISFALSNDSKGTYISSVSFKLADVMLSFSIQDRNSRVMFAVNDRNVNTSGINAKWSTSSYNNIL